MTNLLLYQRIAQQLAEDIRRGVYQPGERVPSVRKMSSQLNVSHATVLQAYANLEDQGLIRARPQSGYYVHQTPALTAPTPDIARVERPGLVTRSSIIQQVLVESRREGVFPLGAAVPSVDYLPVRALHQQLAKVTRFQSPRAFSYMFSPGFEPLRRQVAIRMRDAGVVVDPSEVVITHGCVDALQMSLRVLTRPGDLIAAESPTYYGLLQLADLLGLKVIEIPSDPATGMSLEALQLAANQWSIKALVLTTRLSNPLGATMPEERQKQLLRLASDFDIQIVEDDIYGELMFELGRTKALKAYDRLDRVIYDNRDGDGDFHVTRNLTRYAGLIYELDDHHSVYLSYSDIFTPQRDKDTSGSPLKPIVGKNYEVGVKGEYLGGALNASVALFRVDQENRAVPVVVPNCPQAACSEASGEIRSQGIDLELQGALTPNWQVGGGYTYARTHTIKDDANPQLVNKQFDTDTPERLFKVTTSYHFQGALEKLRVGGNLSWQSRMYNDLALADGSTYRLKQGAYAVTDLMAGYKVNDHLDLQVNANNVFDRRYYSSIANSIQYGGDTYGNPRNMMLTAKYSF